MATERPGASDGGATPQEGARTAQQIAGELRSRIDRGVYRVGQLLPTQRELGADFGVSRDSIQRAMRDLQTEGWIESRQGSGSRVIRARRIHTPKARAGQPAPISLGPLISEAFEAEEVSLDACCLTAEALTDHVGVQADRVARGEVNPRSISLRLLLPSTEPKPAFPAAADDPGDTRPYERWAAMVEFHTGRLRDRLLALQRGKFVSDVDVKVRRAPVTPTHKLYLFNGSSALHGLYVVETRAMPLSDGTEVEALDILGLQSTLFHFEKTAFERARLIHNSLVQKVK
ncbi:winged helix-turn-helix domain-containing protein [Streptomyces sp.]|uniref:winged helix-turn-helix domain-containing protein n=1 Tax=Streptomyces sp. TaxID=1931 RepID=UPI002D79C236|nr:winged helix-turn-helix domain-containing protein [Streptomyces sp.]HET6354616.1 winged helix-turn-helix domain-containing protein [Streptomyces sp.]